MKKSFYLLLLALAAGCAGTLDTGEPTPQEDPGPLSLPGLARVFASLPMGEEQLREVADAVSLSSGNGYDEEYTMDLLLTNPGAGVGPATKAPARYSRPLREMLLHYFLENPATRSDAGDILEALSLSGYQLYWPYSEDWDGETYPIITYDPGFGAESNWGYELAPGPDGAFIADTVYVDEALAKLRPVWVINNNSDSAFTPLELFLPQQQGSPQSQQLLRPLCPPQNQQLGQQQLRPLCPPQSLSKMPQTLSQSVPQLSPRQDSPQLSPRQSGPQPAAKNRTLMLRSFQMLRNYDSWFGGASEFWVKCGSVEGFTASSEAELKLFSPSITDLVIVVKRKYVGQVMPYEAVLVADFTSQMEKLVFMITEDDGGTRTSWKCDATVKIQSKSYGFTVELPLNEKDDIVWRGQIPVSFFQKEDIVKGRFGDVVCTFELE